MRPDELQKEGGNDKEKEQIDHNAAKATAHASQEVSPDDFLGTGVIEGAGFTGAI